MKGRRRGDTLVITIEEIVVDDYSWIAIGPRRGPLGESTRWPELSSDYTTKIFRHTPGPSGTTRDGTLHFDERRSWPITPFIGTLGVAPDREVTTSIDGQGEWGGNLDIRDVAPGNRILLPIFHEGALFYLGDVHASQGDTEFTGTAAETKARIRLRLELEQGKRIPGMRIEKPESLVAIHAEKPLDQAVETATTHLMDWLISEYGFSPVDAYCLVSTCPDFRINVYQMCRIRNLRPVAGPRFPRATCAGDLPLRIGTYDVDARAAETSARSASAVAVREPEGIWPRPAGDTLALGARVWRRRMGPIRTAGGRVSQSSRPG